MAGEVGATSPVAGQGFLDKSGRIKSRETLAKEDTQKTETKSGNSEDASSVSKPTVENALRKVGAQFSQKASAVLDKVNTQDANLKEARSIVKQEIAAARDLKQALKDNDQEKIESSRDTLSTLATQKTALSKRVETDNREVQSSDSVLNLGNQIRGSIKVEPVKISAENSTKADLTTVAGVNALIGNLQGEREDLKAQQVDVKDARREVRAIINDTERDLSRVQEGAIRSFDEAQSKTNQVAASIRESGPSAVLAQNISSTLIQLLR